MAYIPPPRKPARPNLPSPRLDIPLKRPAGPVPVLSSQSLPTLSIPSRTRDEPATTPSSEDALSSARTMPASFLDDGGYDDLEGVSTVRRNDQIQQAIASLSLGPSSNEGSSSASPTTSIRSDPLARHASNGSGTAATDIGGLRWTEADLEDLGGLGAGASGEVRRVRYKPTGVIMAKKTIATSPDPAVHKQILRELSFNRECAAPEIVRCFGASLEPSNMEIGILMEFCEGGSLEAIYKAVKRRQARIGEKILGKIAEAVLAALDYLHDRKIIHRDIKPSNILVDRGGHVKLCDLGVSGQLVNSIAATFTGTSHYMAPERITGSSYTITSDVWSLGLTLHEVAAGRFPFYGEGDAPLGPIELLSYIVKMEAPVLADDETAQWSKAIKDFLKRTLEKDPQVRPTPSALMSHPWIKRSRDREVDMHKWLAAVWEWPS